ncbi:hypothetical protein [Lichenihabitans psoromatis]|uniref:hypothetical protein n=1 Tax=Lichenihabitans psoromatis TaxID=2528642 RepID=UPI0013F16049|nr:hypothetical protein [Lichenihabitans psoromatis]
MVGDALIRLPDVRGVASMIPSAFATPSTRPPDDLTQQVAGKKLSLAVNSAPP